MWIHQSGDMYECSECGTIEHVKTEWTMCPVCGAKSFYKCDPRKNSRCRKGGCYETGGSCELTVHKEYEKGAKE